MLPLRPTLRLLLASSVVALLGGCVIAGDVRPYPAMAPITPIVAPSAQSNRLQGSVTVTVVQRLPNGNLVVQGAKNLRLNQGDELVQVQGIVRAADIFPDNTIPSSRVADARIVYGGRGPVAQSNAMGWLSRFFNSALTPF